jgi:hypothetical protein
MSRASMAAEALPRRPQQLQLRVGDGVHGLVWPPRAVARRLLDGASGAGSKGRLRAPPRAFFLFLPSFLPLLPPFSGGGEVGGKSMGGAVQGVAAWVRFKGRR